jgi:hypothetical protein
MIKRICVCLALTVIQASAQSNFAALDIKTVSQIDRTALTELKQPSSFPPLAAYTRFYWSPADDPNLVFGFFVSPKWTPRTVSGSPPARTEGLPPLVHIVKNYDQYPQFVDADACGYQDFVTYDRALGKFTEARCNGIKPPDRPPPQLPPFITPQISQPVPPVLPLN